MKFSVLQSNLAAPLSGDAIALQELIGDKMQQMLKDTEEALGISMRTYNVYVVESFNHAIRDRNIEDLVSVCIWLWLSLLMCKTKYYSTHKDL